MGRAGAFSEVTGGRPLSFSAEKTRPGASERKKRCQAFRTWFPMQTLLNVSNCLCLLLQQSIERHSPLVYDAGNLRQDGCINHEERRFTMANFLFVLSRDNNEAATRCFQFAQIAHSKGHKTNVFFIDGGVLWADSARDLNLKTETGDCPNDYLPYLVEKAVPIGV